MTLIELNLQELSQEEQACVEGGFLPLILGCIAIYGAVYGAGHAFGEGLKYL